MLRLISVHIPSLAITIDLPLRKVPAYNTHYYKQYKGCLFKQSIKMEIKPCGILLCKQVLNFFFFPVLWSKHYNGGKWNFICIAQSIQSSVTFLDHYSVTRFGKQPAHYIPTYCCRFVCKRADVFFTFMLQFNQ